MRQKINPASNMTKIPTKYPWVVGLASILSKAAGGVVRKACRITANATALTVTSARFS
jgi:hypothetical protein